MPLLRAAAVVVAAAAWLALLAGAPLLLGPASSDAAAVTAAWVYRAGAVLCHQQEGRSFAVHGTQLAVCARCTGLYAGGAAGALLAWILLATARGRARTPSLPLARWRAIAVASGLPMLVAWAAEHAVGAGVSSLARFATALPLGACVAAIVVAWAGGARIDDTPPATAIH